MRCPIRVITIDNLASARINSAGLLFDHGDAVFNGADFNTLRRVEMADAFGAFHRIDFVVFNALRNGLVGAFRLTDIAVDALLGNRKRQTTYPS